MSAFGLAVVGIKYLIVSKIKLIQAKLERAEKHIADIDTAIRLFFESNPYVIVARQDQRTGDYISYVESVRDVPADVSLIAGDALHNTRSALDHLAWQLVASTGSTPGPFTSFPIFDTATVYESGSKRKVRGMRQAAIDAIGALRPYRAGNLRLWQLHRLDIIDKHRMVVTAGSALRGSTIMPSVRNKLLDAFMARRLPGEPIPDYKSLRGRPHVVNHALKKGDIIHCVSESDRDENTRFTFEIAFAEPEVIEGDPVIQTLYQFFRLAGQIVSDFEPML